MLCQHASALLPDTETACLPCPIRSPASAKAGNGAPWSPPATRTRVLRDLDEVAKSFQNTPIKERPLLATANLARIETHTPEVNKALYPLTNILRCLVLLAPRYDSLTLLGYEKPIRELAWDFLHGTSRSLFHKHHRCMVS